MFTSAKIEEIRAEAERDWNSKADQHNQWRELGRDEQDQAFAKALLRHAAASCEDLAIDFQQVGDTYHAGKKAGALACAEKLKLNF